MNSLNTFPAASHIPYAFETPFSLLVSMAEVPTVQHCRIATTDKISRKVTYKGIRYSLFHFIRDISYLPNLIQCNMYYNEETRGTWGKKSVPPVPRIPDTARQDRATP
jgi:hypothetical protein